MLIILIIIVIVIFSLNLKFGVYQTKSRFINLDKIDIATRLHLISRWMP